MAQSRSFLRIVWDFFFKPSRPAYKDSRGSTKAQTKRKAKGQAQSKATSKAVAAKGKAKAASKPAEISADSPQFWGYVDTKGNVRLKASEQIIGRSQKSKKAALDEYWAKYQDQSDRLAVFEQEKESLVAQQTAWADFKALASEIQKTPGLGDVEALRARADAVQATFDAAADQATADRKATLQDLAVLVKRAPSEDVSDELAELEKQWQSLILTGSPEESTLLLKFDRNAKAIRQIETSIGDDTANLASQASSLLKELEAKIDASDWAGTAALLDKTQADRAIYVRALGDQVARDFDMVERVVETNLQELETQQQAKQVEDDAQRQALIDQLVALAAGKVGFATGNELKRLQKSWRLLAETTSQSNANQELQFTTQAAELMDKVRDARQEAEEEREISQAGRDQILTELEQVVSQASKGQTPWREVDQAVQALKAYWSKAGVPSREQREHLSALLAKLNNERQEYYAKQDQGREQALERKRILIADVAKFAPSLSSKQLREHLQAHMETWKQAGSAGREHEEALWQEYQAQRSIVRHEINRLRSVEAGERAERLSQVFADKKAFQSKLETLLMVDELLQEKNPSSSLEKQILRKERDIKKLQDQMMDIQKTLRQLDKVKQQAPELLAEGFDGETEADQLLEDGKALATKLPSTSEEPEDQSEVQPHDQPGDQASPSDVSPESKADEGSSANLEAVASTERLSQDQLKRAEINHTVH